MQDKHLQPVENIKVSEFNFLKPLGMNMATVILVTYIVAIFIKIPYMEDYVNFGYM